MPTPSFQFRGKDDWPSLELDHVFTTLADFSEGKPAAADPLSDLEPTEGMTVTELVARFEAIESSEGWGVSGE